MGSMQPLLLPPDQSAVLSQPPKQLPTKNPSYASERAGRHLARDQSACASVRGCPWKPAKLSVSTLASNHLLSRRKSRAASFLFTPWLAQQPQKGIQLGPVRRQEEGLVQQGSGQKTVTSPAVRTGSLLSVKNPGDHRQTPNHTLTRLLEDNSPSWFTPFSPNKMSGPCGKGPALTHLGATHRRRLDEVCGDQHTF